MLRWRMLRHGAHHVNRLVVVGLERAADVDEPAADDPLEQRALLGQLADRARLALLRVHVHVGARDVQVAADDQRPGARRSAANCSSAARKRIFAGKSLPPFGT
jgi:hypothetical protein